MNRVDRVMLKERKTRYKRLRKLFKARDMATKHISGTLRVTELKIDFTTSFIDSHFTSDLALEIIAYYQMKSRRPKPPIPHSVKKVTK